MHEQLGNARRYLNEAKIKQISPETRALRWAIMTKTLNELGKNNDLLLTFDVALNALRRNGPCKKAYYLIATLSANFRSHPNKAPNWSIEAKINKGL